MGRLIASVTLHLQGRGIQAIRYTDAVPLRGFCELVEEVAIANILTLPLTRRK